MPDPSGPCLVLGADRGHASNAVVAHYWFVSPTGAGCNGYTDARLTWDSDIIVPYTPLDTSDPKYCTVDFKAFTPPKPASFGDHRVTASACYIDLPAVQCDQPGSIVTQTYTIDPIPTMVVKPKSGQASTDFTATYDMNSSQCGFAEAQFYWDGVAMGARVPIVQASCTATYSLANAPKPNGVGGHSISARACSRTCLPYWGASASFTVLPTPTPTPTPTARPTPTPTPISKAVATPTAIPTALPSASVEPSASPSASIEPSLVPSPSAEPSPSGSGEVLGATSPPTPPPGTGVAVTAAGSSAPPGGNPYVAELVTFVGGPDIGSIDPAVVATNLFLTLLILFFFGLTSEVFNSTMDSNRDEVHGWWVRLMNGPLRFMGPLVVTGAGLDRLAGSGRFGSILRVLAVLSLLGLIYGFLSPDFGLNPHSAVLFLSLVVGLGFLTFFSEGSATRLAFSRYHANASVKLYGTAILVAIMAVIVSRLVTFQPGLVYGFIASAVIIAPIALAKRDDATLVLVPAFGLLVVSVLAWLLLGPVRVMAADGQPGPALAQSILAMIVIGGLEGLFITMIPLRFLDGSTVMGWSRVAWALTFGAVTFLWWQLLLNQNQAYVAAFQQTNVQVVLATLVVFMLTTGGLWSYFRFRRRPAEVEAEA